MSELLNICGSQQIDDNELRDLIGGDFDIIKIDENTILVTKEDSTSDDEVNETATKIYSKFLGYESQIYGNAALVLNKQYLH